MSERTKELRCLLLQVRNRRDVMREHEVESFARVLEVPAERIDVLDLLEGSLDGAALERVDLVLLGGSGDYSAAGEGDWLDRALESLRRLHASEKPVFASCWGFQAMARAMGGTVRHDPDRAEVGTRELLLTDEGKRDPIFAPLGSPFLAQMGHEDSVVELPPNTTRLATNERVENQAYRFDDAPIYCTQFHPELKGSDLILRLSNYPKYVERLAGLPPERFFETIEESPETELVLTRFVEQVLG